VNENNYFEHTFFTQTFPERKTKNPPSLKLRWTRRQTWKGNL